MRGDGRRCPESQKQIEVYSVDLVYRIGSDRNSIGGNDMYRNNWQPYVPVAQRKSGGLAYAARIAEKQKRACQPVRIQGKTIAKSFWGKAWCDHVESLSDYANRLPRGRTYVRNGSVVDLVISAGEVRAVVAGSHPYEISISIQKLDRPTWDGIKRDCSRSINSLLDLLGGRLSDGVMRRLTDSEAGCFPRGSQIEMSCDCPDWSACCKHLAAVLYGIGSRLDDEPGLLFLLRGVNQDELINQAVSKENLAQELNAGSGDLAGEDLSAMFGIELDSRLEEPVAPRRSIRKATTKSVSQPMKKKAMKKKAMKKKAVKKKAVKKKAIAKIKKKPRKI